MRLRLSCADFTFPLLPHAQALDLIAALGLQGVDIGLFESRGHLEPSRELKSIGTAARRLRRELDRRGLELADVFLIPGRNFGELAPNHPDAAVRRRARSQFERVVEYTLAAGGRHITALPGITWPHEPRTDSFQRSATELAWRAAYAREAGVTFGVEPHLGSLIARPRDALALATATPGITFTLDYGHFTRAGYPDRAVEPLLKYTSHFHCRGGTRRRLQAPFEENTIDFTRILRVMRQSGYAGFICLEYVWSEWEWCNGTDNLSETIRFRDFLRSAAKDRR
jgi:sugar phosphate isomerase/epimerase